MRLDGEFSGADTNVADCDGEITGLLLKVNLGDRAAFDQLVTLVYDELHRIAEGYVRRESQNLTLQPAALIHEAYLRLVGQGVAGYQSRAHFFGIAARVMRQILVDHARARLAVKRGAGVKVAYEQRFDVAPTRGRVASTVDDALSALAREDGRKALLVEMRFFAGMTTEEIADFGGCSVHTVRRELRAAQAWLRRVIAG